MKEKKSIVTSWLFLCILLFVSCSKSASETPSDDSMDDMEPIPDTNFVDDVLDDYAGSFQEGGVVAYLVTSDGEVQSGSVGNSENNVDLNPNMRFSIGSITKTFTAALILRMIEEGTITLSSTIDELVPERVNEKIPGDIMVGQLLNHSSGLHHPLPGSDGLFNFVIDNPSQEIDIALYESFMETPIATPGEIHSYSDANYKILGAIIEKIQGVPYANILEETILQPYGLTDTYIGTSTPAANQAFSWAGTESLKDLDRTAVESMGVFSGNIWSTPADLTIWFKALFEGTVLTDMSLETIKTFTAGERDVNYGAGMFREVRSGKEIYWHSGFSIAYGSYCGYFPESGAVLVVYFNQFGFQELDAILNDLISLEDL